MGLFSKKVAEPVVLKYDEEKSVRLQWVVNEYASMIESVSAMATWNDETRRTEPIAALLTYEADPRGAMNIGVRVEGIPIGFLSSTLTDELAPLIKRGPVLAAVVLYVQGRNTVLVNACPQVWMT
jgi:hypothetical protein